VCKYKYLTVLHFHRLKKEENYYWVFESWWDTQHRQLIGSGKSSRTSSNPHRLQIRAFMGQSILPSVLICAGSYLQSLHRCPKYRQIILCEELWLFQIFLQKLIHKSSTMMTLTTGNWVPSPIDLFQFLQREIRIVQLLFGKKWSVTKHRSRTLWYINKSHSSPQNPNSLRIRSSFSQCSSPTQQGFSQSPHTRARNVL